MSEATNTDAKPEAALAYMKTPPGGGKESPESGPHANNSGNNSDNSGLVSLGNNSFGFNFENEDSDGNNATVKQESKLPAVPASQDILLPEAAGSDALNGALSRAVGQEEAAATAVASLESIVKTSLPMHSADDESEHSRKRNSLDMDTSMQDSSSSKQSKKSKKPVDEQKREERNQREKERSFRISKQITELRNLLASGGVMVPKGTKSSVLTEAANYIRSLQQHQYRSEIDRHQLIQQMQLIGGGAHGPQAAAAIRHFAAQNGVWSLGNFGGVPPKSAMGFYQPSSAAEPSPAPAAAEPDSASSEAVDSNVFAQSKVEPAEYRFIFNSSGAGMAIASMGGAFIDCNQLFCQLSNYSKQEVCSLTVFNLTAREDLQRAFDQISQLISPPMDENRTDEAMSKPVVIRGAMKDRTDLGMSIVLVKGDDTIAKCFCVTLIKNPTSSVGNESPLPVSFESILQPVATVTAPVKDEGISTAPAFTSG